VHPLIKPQSFKRQVVYEFWTLVSSIDVFSLVVFLKLFTLSLVKGKNHSSEARIFQRIVGISNSRTKWRFAKFATENLENSYSADYQDLAVEFLTSNSDFKLTFLELGAVDGIYKSNCARLEKSGWIGIAVEANPIFAVDFHLNRKSQFINKAVVIQGLENEEILLEYSPNAITSGKITSRDLNSTQETIEVNLITVKQLILHWESNFGIAPTYLSVDIEGLDLPVVTEMLTAGFKPTVITMEHNFRTGELEKIDSLASEFGYAEIYEGLCRNEVILVSKMADCPMISIELSNSRD
jgi:hypothetical protein